jgi:hypothetical protein
LQPIAGGIDQALAKGDADARRGRTELGRGARKWRKQQES